MEEWKDIEGYEGRYQISNTGKVKSLNYHRGQKEQLLKQRSAKRHGNKRYAYVMLSKNNHIKCVYVHRMVAKYFVPNIAPETAIYVNHKDGDKLNNHYTNLEWVTPAENNMHAYHVLGKHSMRGFKYDKNKKSKKVEQWYISEEGYKYHIATYCNAEIAAKINNLDKRSIASCCQRKKNYNQSGGYQWRYVQEV